MPDLLSKLLSERDWLLADGATGTALFNMGLTSGDAPELWNVDKPENIRALYKGPVDAGSDIFLTNSFGANAARLKLHDAGHRAHELSRVAAELARDVADAETRPIVVAGSVGPTGEIMEPIGSLSHTDAVEIFHETAEGLKAGGADVLWVETISAPEEFRAAAEAFARAEMPWCGTMSFDTAGRTMMGVTSSGMAELVQTIENTPVAFGANCGTGAPDLLRTVLGFSATAPEVPIVAKANAGIPRYDDGKIIYDGTPELMGDYAVMVRDAGARIIGGCCGTMPEHLRAMRQALETRPRGDRPTLDQISTTIGAFSSDSDGTGDQAAPQKRTRRGSRRRA
ncbi:MAG: betaine--homocysteine S-methyltransferase [Rhodobacteraceae bacterium]|nr:betaine--homocysteine S-methyltransferase [Paracoccaceae bacterium]